MTDLTLSLLIVMLYILGETGRCACESQCRLKTENLNKRLVGHAVAEFSVPGHHDCARECLSLKLCKSIDYHTEERSFKLYDIDSKSVNNTEFETKSGAVFSDITDWPSISMNKCGQRPCTAKQKCVPSGEKYFCLDIGIDCGFPEIENGNVVPHQADAHGFGDKATVTCELGYYMIGDLTTVFQNTSTWTMPICSKDCFDILEDSERRNMERRMLIGVSDGVLRDVLVVQFTVGNVPKDRFRGWLVKIIYNDEPVCTGTLLSNRFFVTLADCIRPRKKLEDFQLIIGKDTIRSMSYVLESPEGDDVIVGRLSSTVTVNRDDIARIPRIGNENQVEKAGEDERQIYVSGIGENGNKLIVKTRILEDDKCGKKFGDEQYICLSNADSEERLCSLLRGSPVVSYVNRRWTLIGITTVTPETCDRQSKNLNLARHSKWLKQIISLRAGSVCSSTDDCGENMICVQNMCECTYCYKSVDGECIESNKKILVLGAGMSGISAAKTLEENGCSNIQILEGSDRIGGRVKAIIMSGYTLEVGAQWIYGLGSNPIAALAAEYGLSYIEVPDTWTVRDKSGTDLTGQADEEWEKLDRALNKLDKFSKTIINKDVPDITAEGLLRRFGWAPNDNVAEAVEVYTWDIESTKETPSCSGKYLNHLNNFKEHGSDAWPVLSDTRGYSVIIEEMAKTFLSNNDSRLMLNKVVTSIEDWNEEGTNVKVFTADGATYEADRVIVTFSIGVLQSRHVSFVPSLPKWKMLAIDKFGSGQYSILYFKFPNAFWDNTSTIIYAADRHGEDCTWFNMNVVFPGCNILQLALAGFEAKSIERMTDSEVISRGLDTLRSMYPAANITNPEAFERSRWLSDPLAMSSNSYWTPGFTPKDMDDLAKPMKNIFFAGEHLSQTNPGYVHSAYNSGIKTALEIVGRIE